MRQALRHPMIVTGGTLLALFLGTALLATVYTPHDPMVGNLADRHLPPALFGGVGGASGREGPGTG
ncbi:MAG: hypothetical protein KatS3mg115_1665 [Candidatus Poribacteria bacterium]|nr:MAG: hypothetical protein KatS3mg115_1665 [Candidatus Poribacteria bacterium]